MAFSPRSPYSPTLPRFSRSNSAVLDMTSSDESECLLATPHANVPALDTPSLLDHYSPGSIYTSAHSRPPLHSLTASPGAPSPIRIGTRHEPSLRLSSPPPLAVPGAPILLIYAFAAALTVRYVESGAAAGGSLPETGGEVDALSGVLRRHGPGVAVQMAVAAVAHLLWARHCALLPGAVFGSSPITTLTCMVLAAGLALLPPSAALVARSFH